MSVRRTHGQSMYLLGMRERVSRNLKSVHKSTCQAVWRSI
ncbi:hypothetical protein B0G75_107175 [Paraburkholderia sp. BL18I3N2]|nr:hypothetical protein B0G75_107175 [Paraburkholderia sp. BL18I3N2]